MPNLLLYIVHKYKELVQIYWLKRSVCRIQQEFPEWDKKIAKDDLLNMKVQVYTHAQHSCAILFQQGQSTCLKGVQVHELMLKLEEECNNELKWESTNTTHHGEQEWPQSQLSLLSVS